MKTKYKDIIAEDNFRLNSKIYDLGRQAEIIQKLAEEQIKSEGEFAKFHCSQALQDGCEKLQNKHKKHLTFSSERSRV